jgi:Lar family restriction alleviation protein
VRVDRMEDEAMKEESTEPDSRLLPCPHCGAFAWIFHEFGIFPAGGYRVECLSTKCHAMTCYWHTEAQAIEAWNRRAAVRE